MLILWILLLAIILYFSFIIFVYINQATYILCPQDSINNNIDGFIAHGLKQRFPNIKVSTISFKTHLGNTLVGWLYENNLNLSDNGKSNNRSTVLYFHERTINFPIISEVACNIVNRLDMDFIFFGYRGFGKSLGEATIENCIIDSDCIYDYVLNNNNLNISKDNIYIYGKDIGATIAINSCFKYQHLIKGIILENGFSSYSKFIEDLFPFLYIFKKYILKYDINNMQAISQLRCPLLFLVSKEDEIVPFKHSVDLYNNSQLSIHREIKIFSFAFHDDIFDFVHNAYYNKIKEFIENVKNIKSNMKNDENSFSDTEDSNKMNQTTTVFDVEDNILIIEK